MPNKEASAPKPIITKPRLLVFREKHGNLYFYVDNDDKLFASALKVLTERFKDGYWYYKPELEEKPEVPDFNEERVAAMPQSLQPDAYRKLREYNDACLEYDAEAMEYDQIVKAVETKDGRLAYKVLRDRKHAEYEGFSLERPGA